MASFPVLVVLSAAIGFSIYLSMPIVMSRRIPATTVILLNAIALGILVFLIADVFSDVAPLIANPNAPFVTLPVPDLVFVVGAAGAFLTIFFAEHRSETPKPATPTSTAFIVACAIGFQNLTEGLVFGSSWALGLVGLEVVIFVGFFLQNITEGFPIAAPLLGGTDRRVGLFSSLYMIGAAPTILGGAIGFFWHSTLLEILFDAAAIGAILYVILPMLKAALRAAATPEASYAKQRLTYVGIMAGFLLGFAVNAL
jgi:ZIP family zinc transporter